ncbi:MAG: RNA pseudouridine synthase [Candidatus Magasanikbacteria bacterium CG10_big_fil_rev_8_21_14_0_10_36_32]|uniref:RNA pseudouridine synthase n=1 Tax=Candidatus Magasanikbacteria bacterium CG10_big_fil_rev_8_21_14_0_10_36_32 TaxID=1974646 RepID=A0A2M6W7A5_9BACT|nr:MAG: RNA pseudouridine synthase [Candidatus Magasanikbacteria bacterium CG10_big_fil_rev_8_21_14_0_10_36_32]
MSVKVLYEDNHLIAVFKPSGVLVQGDKTGDVCLMDEVKEYLKEKYKKQGNVFLGLLHRLDRPVSGIILFSKTSKGASRLSEQIRNHKIKKEYQALVEGNLKKSKDILINYLLHDEKTNKTQVLNKEKTGAQYAELDYEVLEKRKKNTLLKINLKTGRHHQIRIQLSQIGHPIVGDKKYGAKTPYQEGQIALCAVSLTFQTATGGETKTITTEPSF